MSFNAGWRYFKIIAPEKPTREEELSGGLKNALLRGESLEKAKRSFINAGYKPEEIESASQKVSTTQKFVQQISTSSTTTKQQLPQQFNTTTTTNPKQSKQMSKKFLIIISSISILILIGAGLVGLFWDKIF